MKYFDFVALYASLLQFNESNKLSSHKELLRENWIRTKRRHEISRGSYFPLVYQDKIIFYQNTPLSTMTTNFLFWIKEEHFYKLWV